MALNQDHGVASVAHQIDYARLAAEMVRVMQGGVPGVGTETGAELGVQAVPGAKAEEVKPVYAGAGTSEVAGSDEVVEDFEHFARDEVVFGAIPDSDTDSVASSVSGGAPHEVSQRVRDKVRFGSLDSVYSSVTPDKTQSVGFFGATSTRANTKELATVIAKVCGERVPRQAMVELGISTYAAGAMPAVIDKGATRLRALAAVGDAAITLHLVMRKCAMGEDVASAQNARSKYSSDAHLRKVLIKSGFSRFVTFAAGVDPATASTGATAFEAMVGVMTRYMSIAAVAAFLKHTEVVCF